MIATSTSQRVPFTPPWLTGRAGAPVFFIRPGSLVERSQLEATLASHPYNAGKVYPWDLADVAADAARALLNGEALAQVLEALSTLRGAGGIESVPLAQRQLLIGVDGALMEAWPEYADLRAREARRTEFMPLLACKQFLVGWEGMETPFTADKDGKASEDALRALGSLFLPVVGMEAYRLLYAEDQRPLSPPPSKSAPDRVTSPAGARRRSAAKAGTSTGKSGRKTRA
jgi:hypothetical protein